MRIGDDRIPTMHEFRIPLSPELLLTVCTESAIAAGMLVGMSDQDHRPDIFMITLPHRLLRDGWWLEEHPVTRRRKRPVALKLVKGCEQKDEEWCENPSC
jgi:hypothetical protein